jgi:hypothetical protein
LSIHELWGHSCGKIDKINNNQSLKKREREREREEREEKRGYSRS